MSESLVRVLTIVPAQTEEANEGATVREIRSMPDRYELVVIDDGSRDRACQQMHITWRGSSVRPKPERPLVVTRASVCMASYNSAQYLADQIDAILPEL